MTTGFGVSLGKEAGPEKWGTFQKRVPERRRWHPRQRWRQGQGRECPWHKAARAGDSISESMPETNTFGNKGERSGSRTETHTRAGRTVGDKIKKKSTAQEGSPRKDHRSQERIIEANKGVRF